MTNFDDLQRTLERIMEAFSQVENAIENVVRAFRKMIVYISLERIGSPLVSNPTAKTFTKVLLIVAENSNLG